MHEASIGILLSRQEWNNYLNKKVNEQPIYYYAKKGEELEKPVVYFTLSKISMEDCTVEAAVIKEDTLVKIGVTQLPSIIYNPTKYFLKKNIKKLRELSQLPNVVILNEHHSIKDTHFRELLNSSADLKSFMKENQSGLLVPFTFFVLGQKNTEHKWRIPVLYAKDPENQLHTFDEVIDQLFHDSDDVKEQLVDIFHEAFEYIHFYYPGIYEIGIQFTFQMTGDLLITSTCPVKDIIEDVSEWNKEVSKTIITWPIEIANEFRKRQEADDLNEHTTLLEKEEPLEPSALLRGGRGRHQPKEEEEIVWVRVKEFEHDDMIIRVPNEMMNLPENGEIHFEFGVKEESCNLEYTKEIAPLHKNSFADPTDIYLSSELLRKMHIPLHLTYQLKSLDGKLILGPTIGLVLGEKNQMYHPTYMEKYSDRLGEYEKFGGLVIAFSTRSVDWEEKIVYGMVFDPTEKVWKYGSSPIPSALYRRNFHQNNERVKQLMDITSNKLFNSHHFKKSDLYFMQNEYDIMEHIPTTFLLKDINRLIEFVDEKQKVILKPVSLSRGRGIFILEKDKKRGQGYILYDFRNNLKVQHLLESPDALKMMLQHLKILEQDYLFQTHIPLLKVNNRSFDVRVVMQKYDLNLWGCSGIECRVAAENEDLTNIARGGEAMTLQEVIRRQNNRFYYPRVYKNILSLCQTFCELVDHNGHHYAEFGLDIALDEKGFPWILEANIFPSFKGFKEMDYETYLQIRYQPLFYAVLLQGFQVSEEVMSDEVYHSTKSYL